MKKYIVFALACFSVLGVQAQEKLNNEIIDVVKDFRPKIMQAHKIKSQPLFIDTTKVSENLTYLIRFEEFRVAQNVDSLGAKVLSRIPLTSLFSKHIEIGLGTSLNPHLALDLSNGKSTKSIYQVYLNYNGAFSENMNVQNTYSKLNVGGAYKRVFNTVILQSDLVFEDSFRFGYLSRSYRNSNVAFNSAFQFTDTSRVIVPREMTLSTDVFFRNAEFNEYEISLSSVHSGNYKQLRDWDFGNDLAFIQSNDLNTLHWESSFTSEKSIDRSKLLLGINTDLLANDFKVFPELRAQYELIKKGLFAYSELGGNREVYNLRTVYGANPFTNESSIITTNILPSNTKYFVRVGINGNLFKGVSYQVSVEANRQDAFMHFVQSEYFNNSYGTSLIPKFTEVNMVKLNAQIDAKWTDKFHVWLKGEYKSFDQYLSHVPELKIGLYGDYHYNDQWFISSSVRYIGARSYFILNEGIKPLTPTLPYDVNPMIDLNCKVNFAYNNQIGFYVEGLNLLDNNFDFWQQDLLIGRRLNFGAKYRF